MKNAVILVVDDDPKIRTLLRRCFEGAGSTVREAGDKRTALAILAADPVDLVTLDLDLGHDDGLDVARAMRKTSKVPIIMVTAKDDVIDRVVGLEIGADDYITKPFHLREVLARIKSVLRRTGDMAPLSQPSPQSQCWQFDNMTAVPAEMALRDRDGVLLDLTSGEFKLLEVFLKRPKRVLSREQLMDLTGGHCYAPLDRTIDNQVARLRKKIERNPASPRLISTIRGIGYSFTCEVQSCDGQSPSKSADKALAKSD
ncbi:response regulator transcription factor [Yoonia sp. F2084L]|uniref:response regulator n=1 Tax=Yoonia sp. F2084L TaxID=2926419 RepID=UPI001FF48B52|nr:response regulator transcription factor [Yoonia sp. F2084L]MCK0097348.1 response regulator transcription factor [Yoonia sp. F2084L]